MDGFKKFPTSLFGFSKKKVITFLDNILTTYETQLQEKSDENLALSRLNMELLTQAGKIPVLEASIERLERTVTQREQESLDLNEQITRMHDYLSQKEETITQLNAIFTEKLSDFEQKRAALDAEHAKVIAFLMRAEEAAQLMQANTHSPQARLTEYPVSQSGDSTDNFQMRKDEFASFRQRITEGFSLFDKRIDDLA